MPPKWPILCWVGHNTTTQSTHQSVMSVRLTITCWQHVESVWTVPGPQFVWVPNIVCDNDLFKTCLSVSAPVVCNSLAKHMHLSSISKGQFQHVLKTHVFQQVYIFWEPCVSQNSELNWSCALVWQLPWRQSRFHVTYKPLVLLCHAGPSEAHDCILLRETVWNLHDGHGNVELFLKHSRAEKLDRCSGGFWPVFLSFLQICWTVNTRSDVVACLAKKRRPLEHRHSFNGIHRSHTFTVCSVGHCSHTIQATGQNSCERSHAATVGVV